LKIPLVFGSALRWEGQLSVFNTAVGGPCYRCIYPNPPEVNDTSSCELLGVVGIAPGIIGILQVTKN
jgi:sulfur-carrier protein adenylyltransferase/sulfurtransferase